jgi:hypothetical protein
MQTQNGPNTATLRYKELNKKSVQIFVEEETSQDAEIDHIDEVVGYMVLWNAPPPPPPVTIDPVPV